MTNPWRSALMLPSTDQQIADRVRIASQPVHELYKLEAGIGAPILHKAFKSFYDPSEQDLKIIREIVSSGAAYASHAHASLEHFRSNAQCRMKNLPEAPTRMLTGHSGVGKSALLAAVPRMLQTDETLDAGPDLAPSSSTVSHLET